MHSDYSRHHGKPKRSRQDETGPDSAGQSGNIQQIPGAANADSESVEELSTEMWKTVMSMRPASPTEVTAQEHALSELSSLDQYRLTRLRQSTTRLPNVLWCVLLVGGVLTIAAACTFGVESLRLQALQIFSFSLLISLSLVAIADIHRPLQGLIHVSDNAFRRAQQSMRAR